MDFIESQKLPVKVNGTRRSYDIDRIFRRRTVDVFRSLGNFQKTPNL